MGELRDPSRLLKFLTIGIRTWVKVNSCINRKPVPRAANRDPEWETKLDRDPGTGSEMNIPDHFSERLETVFGLQILKFFDADPESF